MGLVCQYIAAHHNQRGLPKEGFRKIYTQFCKSLVAVGAGAGQDTRTGIETEFVTLSNPYTDDLTKGLMVQLLYQGMKRAGAQVEIFERAPDGIAATRGVVWEPLWASLTFAVPN